MIKGTQKAVVLRFIEEHGSNTSADAFGLGITRLAAVICQIKKDGIPVKAENERVDTRYGPTTISRYSLCETIR